MKEFITGRYTLLVLALLCLSGMIKPQWWLIQFVLWFVVLLINLHYGVPKWMDKK